MMSRWRSSSHIALLALLAASLAACAPDRPSGANGRKSFPDRAEPSTVIATELAFARTAQEKGQWSAFFDYAAKDAVMFVPEKVSARTWLRQQQNPPEAMRWRPHHIWSSCDGSIAVTRGTWQYPDGSAGRFATIWERQHRDRYRWVLEVSVPFDTPSAAHDMPEIPEAPEMIVSTNASCTGTAKSSAPAVEETSSSHTGHARDGTMHWRANARPDGRHTLALMLWDGSEMTRLDVLPGSSAPD